MNYKKLYDNIINRRKLETFEGYGENHHIIPRSLGGTDDKDNIVRLTAREHFICHYLLTKIYNDEKSIEYYKMINAFIMMKCSSLLHYRYFNSRLYENAKTTYSKIKSSIMKTDKNPTKGKVWISNIEDKISKIWPKDTEIPYGWVKGRNKWNELERLTKIKENIENKIKNKKLRKENIENKKLRKEQAYYHWKLYNDNNCKALGEYYKLGFCKYSQTWLGKLFKEYISEYMGYRGFKGNKHSEEAKKKISEKLTKKSN